MDDGERMDGLAKKTPGEMDRGDLEFLLEDDRLYRRCLEEENCDEDASLFLVFMMRRKLQDMGGDYAHGGGAMSDLTNVPDLFRSVVGGWKFHEGMKREVASAKRRAN